MGQISMLRLCPAMEHLTSFCEEQRATLIFNQKVKLRIKLVSPVKSSETQTQAHPECTESAALAVTP